MTSVKVPRKPKVESRQIDYTPYARDYDQRRFAGELTYYEWLRQQALGHVLRSIPRNSSILDVGCGTGRGILTLAQLGFQNVTGLDFTASMLGQAEAKIIAAGRRPRLLRGDAFSLPFEDGRFDIVISFNFLHMFEFRLQQEIVAEMRRVARSAVVIELESIHKGLVVSRYAEQRRMRNRTKFNSCLEVRRLFNRDHFSAYHVSGSVLPFVHRFLKRAPALGASVDALTRLPLIAWLAARVFVLGIVRDGGASGAIDRPVRPLATGASNRHRRAHSGG